MNIGSAAEYVWKRHQSHWNWIAMLGSLAVFLMALWFHSVVLFFVFLAGVVCSLCELPEPVPPFRRIDRLLDLERRWLAAPWGWKKGLQAFGLFFGAVYVCVSCWISSIMALLLFVGICVNIGCVYGNKAMGIDDL
ncbi:hypothetical protein [Maridesulfovibrio sp. FT414]|uniref:hypothetical protein n=1 Tax=Maridesulfovibrio sp. FT414 TaxID=2979469 RepID=UPI003D805668